MSKNQVLIYMADLKVLRQKSHLNFSSTKKPLHALVFKIPSFSNYILLPAFIQLFKTFLETTKCNLLHYIL